MQRFIIVASVAAIATATVSAAPPKELLVVLKWNPNAKPSAPAIDTTGGLLPFVMAPMVDKRDKGTQIGENVENKTPVPVHTKSDVAAYVHENLLKEIRRYGLDVQAAETGDRVLRSELVEFWVTEGHHYEGSVRLRITMANSAGKELWSGIVGGASDNFGRSLKPANYTEAFSNSILELAGKLLAAPGFRQAIARTP